ncbi:exodeoxyribonuclease VII small subunit [Clostridium celatum]|uniref:Exodeoxyribonuclease 7 small subunit n=1 Tax=Clostridium celatum DSM 1785 TaxID=545697 RepID=L1QGD6_9CLOT|nr:exodeoxyribonuclease VII small subunit [Clostridium celatum]EKY27001.1 exodeoxyribonuclease VII, small subunit [Clostridium celatum DSM 1785]MCE9654740.1 exodeoxyribonuclease VII small subunit [Clostridium celatum]MDU3723019.1 exodeoxyribonuclease VII small subunit [Clostridium celatum]MDY3359302.1 exodeoxyribonuclease VII small subunit [Clostridium celatum]
MAKKESYNDMLNNLEEILSTLEKDELSLEEAMKEYEKGSKLINKLYKTLDNLEGKFITIKENIEVVKDDDN